MTSFSTVSFHKSTIHEPWRTRRAPSSLLRVGKIVIYVSTDYHKLHDFFYPDLPKLALPLPHYRKLKVYPLGPSSDQHPTLLTFLTRGGLFYSFPWEWGRGEFPKKYSVWQKQSRSAVCYLQSWTKRLCLLLW